MYCVFYCCWDETHRFLWNFVGNLVCLVEETYSWDVPQRSKASGREKWKKTKSQQAGKQEEETQTEVLSKN